MLMGNIWRQNDHLLFIERILSAFGGVALGALQDHMKLTAGVVVGARCDVASILGWLHQLQMPGRYAKAV